MSGEYLLRVFAVVFQKIPASTATDHGKAIFAKTILKRAKTVIVTDNQSRLANPFKPRIESVNLFDPPVQGLGLGGVADMRPNLMAFLRQSST